MPFVTLESLFKDNIGLDSKEDTVKVNAVLTVCKRQYSDESCLYDIAAAWYGNVCNEPVWFRSLSKKAMIATPGFDINGSPEQTEIIKELEAIIERTYESVCRRISSCLAQGMPTARYAMGSDVSPFFVGIIEARIKERKGLESKLHHESGGKVQTKNELVVHLEPLYHRAAGVKE